MIIRLLIVFSIIFQGFNFAGSLDISQCKILKFEKSNCCETPKTCCCKKSNICKCTIKKPVSNQDNSQELIISKTNDSNELNELSHISTFITKSDFTFSQNFIFNFILKTYQAYTNLPLLA